MTNRVLPSSKQ